MNSLAASRIGFAETQHLLKAAKAGDERAFTQLIVMYRNRVLKVALRIIGNAEDAEDAVQTACMKAFVKLPLFREEASFYTWLCRITANECLSQLRSRKHWNGVISIDQETGESNQSFELPDPNVDPETAYRSKEVSGHLHRAIGRLSPRWQQIVRMRHLEERSELEIGAALQMSRACVKTAGYRAKKRLRRHLSSLAAQPFPQQLQL
jgi:RNA polymerase sigma-70 factor (ECF subfamily)